MLSVQLGGEGPGDVLVFLPGEREIRDTADALVAATDPARTEIVPLDSRLSAAEQHRVFSSNPSTVRRSCSLRTWPRARSPAGHPRLVDTGVARISRYSVRPRCNGCRPSW